MNDNYIYALNGVSIWLMSKTLPSQSCLVLPWPLIRPPEIRFSKVKTWAILPQNGSVYVNPIKVRSCLTYRYRLFHLQCLLSSLTICIPRLLRCRKSNSTSHISFQPLHVLPYRGLVCVTKHVGAWTEGMVCKVSRIHDGSGSRYKTSR